MQVALCSNGLRAEVTFSLPERMSRMNQLHHILCVEDSMADLGLLMEAFVELDLPHNLYHVCDGEKAMAFLRREYEYATVPRPDLVVLDLNLPKKSGFEVLQEVSRDPNLRTLDFAVLTTVAREFDVKRSAPEMSVHFMIKPTEFHALVDVVRQLDGLLRGVRTLGAA